MAVESWKLFFEIGGLIVLALTFIFGGGAWMTTNILNKRQDAQLRAFDKGLIEAKRALSEAEKANLRLRAQVADVENQTTIAQKDLVSLQKAAADARAAQQRVQLALAREQERAAVAERALLEVQHRIADRHIDAQSRDALITILAAFRPVPSIRFTVNGSTPEAIRFATEIARVLDDAGWTAVLSESSVATYIGSNPQGLFICVHDLSNVPPEAMTLQAAFRAGGFESIGIGDPTLKVGETVILVGVK